MEAGGPEEVCRPSVCCPPIFEKSGTIDVVQVLEELDQRLSGEIRRRKGLEFRLAELSTVSGTKSPPEHESAGSATAAGPSGPEHTDDDSELHTLRRLISEQAALLETLRAEKQDLAAANASVTEKVLPPAFVTAPRQLSHHYFADASNTQRGL